MLEKPKGYTDRQWEIILCQADEWGLRFQMGFPGTVYDEESKIWDFSGNEDAVKILGKNPNGEYKMGMVIMARI